MSIFRKMKDILFDEEEVVEEEIEEVVVKNKEEVKPQVVREEIIREEVSEKETYRSDKTFPFPDFDEDEFETSIYKTAPKINTRQTPQTYNYERPLKRSVESFSYEKPVKKVEKPKEKFTPSSIISPVYGVLNRNYESDDIVERSEKQVLNVDNVRKKAFGEIEELEKSIDKTVSEFYQKKEPIKREVEEIVETNPVDKTKTIDELLEVTDEIMISEEEMEMPKIDSSNIEDTLESDLFDLIDSMYENKEGE